VRVCERESVRECMCVCVCVREGEQLTSAYIDSEREPFLCIRSTHECRREIERESVFERKKEKKRENARERGREEERERENGR